MRKAPDLAKRAFRCAVEVEEAIGGSILRSCLRWNSISTIWESIETLVVATAALLGYVVAASTDLVVSSATLLWSVVTASAHLDGFEVEGLSWVG